MPILVRSYPEDKNLYIKKADKSEKTPTTLLVLICIPKQRCIVISRILDSGKSDEVVDAFIRVENIGDSEQIKESDDETPVKNPHRHATAAPDAAPPPPQNGSPERGQMIEKERRVNFMESQRKNKR
ncbi:hypothetical protein Y032_0089g2214 [Ancylostoma ceylanicum]|uniref:Uncharacterized protein n=1 Tax=Ancylostoma ceylanicum TaxID=53326 RepID=A0A016TN77_9BILA|nr:hypothetical protein Y032_0089g2214 [Ancylostoma ceylanicum]